MLGSKGSVALLFDDLLAINHDSKVDWIGFWACIAHGGFSSCWLMLLLFVGLLDDHSKTLMFQCRPFLVRL